MNKKTLLQITLPNNFLFPFLVVLLIPACTHRNQRSFFSRFSKPVSSVNDASVITNPVVLRQLEAQLFDVEPLFDAQLMRAAIKSDDQKGAQWLLAYESKQSMDTIMHWYDEQMEYHGWVKEGSIESFQAMMLFGKPGRKCQIMIESVEKSNKKIVVWVFESPKNG